MDEREQGQNRTTDVRGHSVFGKAFLPILVITAVEVMMCVLIFLLSGTMSDMKNKEYMEFRSKVTGRSEKVQQMMADKSEFVQYYKKKMEAQVSKILIERNRQIQELQLDEELNGILAIDLTVDIKDLMRASKSTGAFVIFNGTEDEKEAYTGYYLRNLNYGSMDSKYYTVLRGTETLVRETGIKTDENWRSSFRITDNQNSLYYNKICEMYEENIASETEECGYWSPAFCMYGDDREIITYTVPLESEDGVFYGVLGIELSQQFLMEELPYKEINSDGTGSYYLVYREDDGDSYRTMAASAASGKNITDKDGYIQYTKYENREHFYHMKENLSDDYVGVWDGVELYSQNSPHSSEKWAVIGVESEQKLLSRYKKYVVTLCVAIVMMVLLGVVQVIYICIMFGGQLRQITAAAYKASPEKEIHIPRSGIRDLDKMGVLMENLIERDNSSTKLAEVTDLLHIPIGAIEYRPDENYVFYTESAAEILELHVGDGNGPYLSRKQFEVETEVLKKNLLPYEAEDDVYYMTERDGSNKWIRIKTIENDDRVLIAIMDVTTEIEEKRKIEYERDYDILTRLLNRTAFRARMGRLLKKGGLGTAAVVMMDLDNLKYFNDTYGHEYGDKYIREAAVVLSTMNQYKALVARMSGDEFLMFIYGYSDKDEIRSLVYDVHKRLMESYIKVPTGENIKLRASAGIAWYPTDGVYLDELIKYADFAMYEIKSTIKGAIKEFDSEEYQKDAILFTGKEELNRLLEEPDMLQYSFQPIVSADSGEVFGYEALMRPQIESLKSPEDVMRLAKAQSKLYQVEKATWMSVMKAVKNQKETQYKIFINSVPNHVLDDMDMMQLEGLYGDLIQNMIIEIIESEQTDKSCMTSKREWAKKHGAGIALDDFGTGYSNESTLLYIKPDYVKLDMSIIRNIHADTSRQKIVQGLLDYTKAHGIRVIAEGIECREEMEAVLHLGVEYMQGWYLSKGDYQMRDIPQKIKEEIRSIRGQM